MKKKGTINKGKCGSIKSIEEKIIFSKRICFTAYTKLRKGKKQNIEVQKGVRKELWNYETDIKRIHKKLFHGCSFQVFVF